MEDKYLLAIINAFTANAANLNTNLGPTRNCSDLSEVLHVGCYKPDKGTKVSYKVEDQLETRATFKMEQNQY